MATPLFQGRARSKLRIVLFVFAMGGNLEAFRLQGMRIIQAVFLVLSHRPTCMLMLQVYEMQYILTPRNLSVSVGEFRVHGINSLDHRHCSSILDLLGPVCVRSATSVSQHDLCHLFLGGPSAV